MRERDDSLRFPASTHRSARCALSGARGEVYLKTTLILPPAQAIATRGSRRHLRVARNQPTNSATNTATQIFVRLIARATATRDPTPSPVPLGVGLNHAEDHWTRGADV